MPPMAASLEIVFREDIAVDSLSREWKHKDEMICEKPFCQNDLATPYAGRAESVKGHNAAGGGKQPGMSRRVRLSPVGVFCESDKTG
ncbi:hypothetical protein GCM10027405_32320 [Arthrobacter alkaliphilus]